MARPRLHSDDDLLDVAEELVTLGDPAGLTLRSLATAAGASNGTIYHAFGSKQVLLARMWLRAWSRLSSLTLDAVARVDAAHDKPGHAAVVAAGLAPVDFVRTWPGSARLFFAQRRDQLYSGELPVEIADAFTATQTDFVGLLRSLAEGVWGRHDRYAVEAIATCIVDLPTGILRRQLLEGRDMEAHTSRRLEAAIRAILDVPLEEPRPRR